MSFTSKKQKKSQPTCSARKVDDEMWCDRCCRHWLIGDFKECFAPTKANHEFNKIKEILKDG